MSRDIKAVVDILAQALHEQVELISLIEESIARIRATRGSKGFDSLEDSMSKLRAVRRRIMLELDYMLSVDSHEGLGEDVAIDLYSLVGYYIESLRFSEKRVVEEASPFIDVRVDREEMEEALIKARKLMDALNKL